MPTRGRWLRDRAPGEHDTPPLGSLAIPGPVGDPWPAANVPLAVKQSPGPAFSEHCRDSTRLPSSGRRPHCRLDRVSP